MKINPLKAGVVFALFVGFTSRADIFYNTFPNYNGSAFTMTNNEVVGNEVFSSGGVLSPTNFSIEYYSPNTSFSGTVQADVKFYYNNGTPFNGYGTPGSLFFDSGWFGALPANGFQVLSYDSSDLYNDSTLDLVPNFKMPSDFTFTITFQGLNGGDQIELPLASPDLTDYGTGEGDYWLYTGSGWELLTNNVSDSMVAGINGTIPEPSALMLGALGGGLLLLAAGWFRKVRSA